MNFKRGLALVVLVGGTVAGLGMARADPDCIDLFLRRNRIYAEAHYCFKTKEVLAYFSNKGCIPGKPYLTAARASQVAEIRREERRDNCRTQ